MRLPHRLASLHESLGFLYEFQEKSFLIYE